ncbi:MAG: fluoroquinolone transporter permease [Streptosporangiales bacterium]|nr:fluoroquinolone transporter permease [Streptosporangiales bacterium]
MTTPLSAAVKLDFRLQRRYGFFYAAAFVILLWIGVLRIVPEDLLGPAMPYILFGDVQFFYFFIAGAVFFEKGERTLFALLTTPLRFRDYLTAKLVSMSTLAFVTLAVIVLVDYGLGFRPLPLLAGVVFMTLLMILAGFITAPLYPSVSEWFMPSTLLLLVVNAPAIDYTGLWPHPLFYLIPTEAPYLLLGTAFGQVSLSPWQAVYAVGYPLLWIGLLCLLARWVFYRYVVTREGGQ